MFRKIVAVVVSLGGVITAGAVVAAGVAPAQARTALPPQGARAQVQVSPNPTTRQGEEVTITGSCQGGTGLKAVSSGAYGGVPALEDIRIIKTDPNGFEARATVSETIGNGVGPVFVDCGGEVGVTLLVTHV
ncbi:MAG TPA: hypothetical protein VFG87_03255 [Amycolatopsis sp.]|nr:hypothetical protein [Amycolatopsis sp.]